MWLFRSIEYLLFSLGNVAEFHSAAVFFIQSGSAVVHGIFSLAGDNYLFRREFQGFQHIVHHGG